MITVSLTFPKEPWPKTLSNSKNDGSTFSTFFTMWVTSISSSFAFWKQHTLALCGRRIYCHQLHIINILNTANLVIIDILCDLKQKYIRYLCVHADSVEQWNLQTTDLKLLTYLLERRKCDEWSPVVMNMIPGCQATNTTDDLQCLLLLVVMYHISLVINTDRDLRS